MKFHFFSVTLPFFTGFPGIIGIDEFRQIRNQMSRVARVVPACLPRRESGFQQKSEKPREREKKLVALKEEKPGTSSSYHAQTENISDADETPSKVAFERADALPSKMSLGKTQDEPLNMSLEVQGAGTLDYPSFQDLMTLDLTALDMQKSRGKDINILTPDYSADYTESDESSDE